MKKQLISLLAMALCSTAPAFAAPISQDDQAAIAASLNTIAHAVENHDAQFVADHSSELLIDEVGSHDTYLKMVDASFKSLEAKHYKLKSYITDVPHESVDAGKYEVCIVKETITFDLDGRTLRGEGFSLATHKKTEQDWKFIDGSGLSKHPGFLKKVLPDLPDSFQIPKISATVLSDTNAPKTSDASSTNNSSNANNTGNTLMPVISADKVASIANKGKTFPMVIDEETSMLALRGDKDTLYYHFVVTTPLKDDEERAVFSKTLKEQLDKRACTSKDFSGLIAQGYKLDFTYLTPANEELVHTRMEASRCKDSATTQQATLK